MWFDFNHILRCFNGDEICRLLISIFVVRCCCDRTVFLITTVDGSGFCVDVRHGIVKSWTASRNHIVSSEPASLQAIGAYFSSIVSLNGGKHAQCVKMTKKSHFTIKIFSLFWSQQNRLNSAEKAKTSCIANETFLWFFTHCVISADKKLCAITWTFVERSCISFLQKQSFRISR